MNIELQEGQRIKLNRNVGARGLKGQIYDVKKVSKYDEQDENRPLLNDGSLFVTAYGYVDAGYTLPSLGKFEYFLYPNDYEIQ